MPEDLSALLEELAALPPRERVASLTRAGPPQRVLMDLGDAAEQLAVTDAGRAVEAAVCLVDIADEVGAPLARARVRRAMAHALCNAGRLEEGWRLCDAAAKLAEAADEPVEAGRARLRSMQALGELGRFDESIAAGEAARAAFSRAGEEALAARAEVNLGIVFQRRDEPARAVEYFERARPRLGEEPFAVGTVDNNRGEALLALNDFAGARAAFESALAHYERADAKLVAGVAEGNLADLAARQGLLHRATFHFERARRRFESTQSTGHLARLLTELAESISVLGMPDDALKHYEQALPQLDRAGQALEAARARAGLGRTLLQLKRFSEAETALAAAASAFDQLGHNTARARVDLIRAELATANGLAGAARQLIHGALAVLHDQPVDAATARHLLARIALDEGYLDEAEAELAAALSLARRLDVAPLLADVLHTTGRVRRRQGDLAAAVRNLEEATAQVERVRSTLTAQRFRGAFLGDRLAIYEDMIATLLEAGGPRAVGRAFAVAEQAKSRLLLDLMRGELELEARPDEGPSMDPQERRLVEEFTQTQGALNGLYSRLADEHRAGAGDASWQKTVIDHEQRLETLESRLSTTPGAAGLYARPADLDGAAAALAGGTVLIEYAFAGGEVLAFVIRSGAARAVRGLCSVEELDDRVARLQMQIDRALRPGAFEGWRRTRLLGDVEAELSELHATLMAPLLASIDPGERLLVVPHGALHLLPFHAFRAGERYLVEEHEISYAPSASVLARLRGRGSASSRRAVVIGVADAAAPRIEAEAARVGRVLGADAPDILVGEAATVDRVCHAMHGAGLVHLACHARFSATTPLGSGVRLADRWLNVREIFSLRLDAGLVTLSGCETGRGLVRAGDELMGLLRGFLAAGASSLLVSLWRVDDETAAEMMSVFYERWRADSGPGRSKAAALREAQLEALDRQPHPAFWAPFQLVGEP